MSETVRGECFICKHEKRVFQIEHADESTNPPTFSVSHGHARICQNCYDLLVATNDRCPFDNHERWRIASSAVAPMEVDDPVEDVRELYASPPASPAHSNKCEWVWERKPRKGCTGPFARGGDGHFYCPPHIQLGPGQAIIMERRRQNNVVKTQQATADRALKSLKRQREEMDREEQEIERRRQKLVKKFARVYISGPQPNRIQPNEAQ